MPLTMSASSMPKLSLMTLASGARQLVVHEALLQTDTSKRLVRIEHTFETVWVCVCVCVHVCV